jgi:asparagine synthase (glutamine-hydrolysing)
MFIDPALRARLAEQDQQPFAQTERERHYQDLTGAMQPYAFEVLDRAAAAYGIEARYPLWDKRLAEFCLALPGRQKLHQGRDRYVFRNAMRDILPPEVQWRTNKTDFISNISRALLSADRERIDALLLDPPHRLEAYSDLAAVQQSYLQYRAQPERCSPYELFALWRVACLALWLRLRQAAPSMVSQPYTITSLTAATQLALLPEQSR